MKRHKSNWIWWIGAILGVIWASRTIGNISRLVKVSGRVDREKQELAAAETENSRLKDRLEEVQTPEFIEREAREKLGLGMPGEMVVIIPEQENSKSEILSSKRKEQNWRLWRKLYLGF